MASLMPHATAGRVRQGVYPLTRWSAGTGTLARARPARGDPRGGLPDDSRNLPSSSRCVIARGGKELQHQQTPGLDGLDDSKNGVFALLLINFGVHIAATSFLPGLPSMLALSHQAPVWWQFITAAFVHANWDHLFGNAFSLLVFGRMVEEEEGAFGLWLTYLVCGVAGNVASYLSSPHSATVSLGASSAVFGLFAVGVLTKVRLDLRRMLEALVLGAYVWRQVMSETAAVLSGGTTVGGMSVGHWAHLGGAIGGVLLVLLLSRLPKGEGDDF